MDLYYSVDDCEVCRGDYSAFTDADLDTSEHHYCRVGFPVSSRRKPMNTSNRTKKSTAKAVTHKEISGFPLKPQYPVPMHSNRPSVQRTIRIVPLTAVVFPFDVTPALITLEDQTEYGSTASRFTSLRILSARVWGSESLSGTDVPSITVTFRMPPGTSTALAGPVLEVLNDQATPGAERCCVGYVYPYASRTLPFLVTSTTPIFTVDKTPTGPLGRTGDIVIDVTVLFD